MLCLTGKLIAASIGSLNANDEEKNDRGEKALICSSGPREPAAITSEASQANLRNLGGCSSGCLNKRLNILSINSMRCKINARTHCAMSHSLPGPVFLSTFFRLSSPSRVFEAPPPPPPCWNNRFQPSARPSSPCSSRSGRADPLHPFLRGPPPFSRPLALVHAEVVINWYSVGKVIRVGTRE